MVQSAVEEAAVMFKDFRGDSMKSRAPVVLQAGVGYEVFTHRWPLVLA